MNKELLVALLLAAVAIVFGTVFDQLAYSLLAASLIWIASQFLEFRKLRRWSRRPLRRPENASNAWYQTAIVPFRLLQRERSRSRRLLSRLREVLALVEVIPDAVVILNSAGDIEGFNQAAQRLLNLSENDPGISLSSVVRNPEFVAFLKNDSQQILEFTSPFDPERTLEARRFSVEENRFVVLVRDITELNRLLTMRQTFVANVSHELRTPLTVVAGYLETMADEEQPEQLRLSLISKLTSPLQRIRSLVDDLLLLTRLESTPVPDQLDAVAMNQVINQAVAEVQGLISQSDQIRVSCDERVRIFGIEAELYSVCVNLLSNAIRYSPDHTDVEISWQRDGDKARLEVTDHGVGIAPEHLSRITERFYRVDMADARTRGGTGLGLAIVKHVLRRHGSELEVDSVLGEGSRFYCDFRLADSHSEVA